MRPLLMVRQREKFVVLRPTCALALHRVLCVFDVLRPRRTRACVVFRVRGPLLSRFPNRSDASLSRFPNFQKGKVTRVRACVSTSCRVPGVFVVLRPRCALALRRVLGVFDVLRPRRARVCVVFRVRGHLLSEFFYRFNTPLAP